MSNPTTDGIVLAVEPAIQPPLLHPMTAPACPNQKCVGHPPSGVEVNKTWFGEVSGRKIFVAGPKTRLAVKCECSVQRVDQTVEV